MPIAEAPIDQEPSPLRERVVFTLWCVLGGLVAAVPAGWVWSAVAGPPSGQLTESGVFFGEEQLDQVAGVTMWFLIVSLVFGMAAGLVVGGLGARHGLVAVLAILLCSAAATCFTYWWGAHVFGPDEQAQLADARIGDQITAALGIGTNVVYLGWPIGGLVGALAAIFGWPKDDRPAETPPATT